MCSLYLAIIKKKKDKSFKLCSCREAKKSNDLEKFPDYDQIQQPRYNRTPPTH